MVLVHGSQFIEEIKRVPESILSFMEIVDEVCVVNSMPNSGIYYSSPGSVVDSN